MRNLWKKDPSDVLDWAFDWSNWLATGETIASHTVTVQSGLTLDSSTDTADTVTAWISGGTVGVKYTVACLINTDQGRTAERTIYIQVAQR